MSDEKISNGKVIVIVIVCFIIGVMLGMGSVQLGRTWGEYERQSKVAVDSE